MVATSVHLRATLLGKSHGSFRRCDFSAPHEFGRKLEQEASLASRKKKLVYLRTNFSGQVLCEEDLEECLSSFGALRSNRQLGDAIILHNQNPAVLICSGDCPVVSLFNPRTELWAVIHAGFRSLYPESLIDSVLFTIPVSDWPYLTVFAGYGIGPCCYGVEGLLHAGLANERHISSVASKGPRRGQPSIDLISLIEEQLLDAGIPPAQITLERTCTACSGRKDDSDKGGNYWSHAWDEAVSEDELADNALLGDDKKNRRPGGRNLCVLWID